LFLIKKRYFTFLKLIFSCETQYKRKQMQYAAAMNNTRTAGGSIGRQGRVSFALIFKR
jgi:hypothetical protein